jgi:hypothetical protein
MRNERFNTNIIPETPCELISPTLKEEDIIRGPQIRDRSQTLKINKIEFRT